MIMQRWVNDLFKSGFKDEEIFAWAKQAYAEVDSKSAVRFCQRSSRRLMILLLPAWAFTRLTPSMHTKTTSAALYSIPMVSTTIPEL